MIAIKLNYLHKEERSRVCNLISLATSIVNLFIILYSISRDNIKARLLFISKDKFEFKD